MAEEAEKVSSSASEQSYDQKQAEDNVRLKPQAQAQAQAQGFSGYYPGLQYEEHLMNGGAGIYAVPFAGHVAAPPSYNLIPLTYNLPTSRPRNEVDTGGEGNGQLPQQQLQQQQQPAHQRQVVEWRFEIAFQLDLFLILKLAAVVFLFNQDGSRQRLALLVFFATMIYLYQTGALRPFVRWLSRVMHRAAAPPPRPQRPVVRADNNPAAAERPLNDDAVPEGQGREENIAENGVNANENENVVGPNAGNQWWGILKEIQMIVFGFITSLFPGFNNID